MAFHHVQCLYNYNILLHQMMQTVCMTVADSHLKARPRLFSHMLDVFRNFYYLLQSFHCNFFLSFLALHQFYCLNVFQLEMYKAGYFLRMSDLADPTSGRFSQLLKKIIHFPITFRSSASNDILKDRLILLVMLEVHKFIGLLLLLFTFPWVLTTNSNAYTLFVLLGVGNCFLESFWVLLVRIKLPISLKH